MEQVAKQLSDVVAINASETFREILIQIDGEWGNDFLMNDYRTGIRISQRLDYNPKTRENVWHPPLVHVSYSGASLSALEKGIKLVNSILIDIETFWKDVMVSTSEREVATDALASRSRPRKQMRSEVQFFLDKFFLPSVEKLESTNTLELRSTPKLLSFGVSDSYELCAITADFDSEIIRISTEISNRGAVQSLPIDCSLGELKGAIRSQVDSILERLAEDVREGVENFDGKGNI